MNILVIGGSGLFGGKTVLHLARDPEVDRVVSMDVVPPKDWIVKSLGDAREKFGIVPREVLDPNKIAATLKGFQLLAFKLGLGVD